MSKKNNGKKDKRYIKFLLATEKERQAKSDQIAKKKAERAKMSAQDAALAKMRKEKARKAKVAPVIGSQVKASKMLKRALRSMNLGGKKKINMDSSASSDDSEDSDDMAIDEVNVPKVKAIKKKHLSKSDYKQMKKSLRRKLKDKDQLGKLARKWDTVKK